MERSGGELAKRVGVAAVGIPITLVLGYMGGYWLAALVAVFAGVAAWEFCGMYRVHGVPSSAVVAGTLAVAYVLIAASTTPGSFAVWATILTLGVATVVMLRTPPELGPGQAVVTTIFGAAYTGVLLSYVVWLRAFDTAPGIRGAAIVFLPVAVTWLGDSAAYFTGKAIGRHKLAPVISPKKTWEGAIGGFVVTAGTALLYVELTRPLVGWTMSTAAILGLGAVVAVAGQLGDLVESRFKRDCGVKDSSKLLPGHGGALDRVDSLLFVMPTAYAYLRLVAA
jgi:phosphatidate cytidylyltransferase